MWGAPVFISELALSENPLNFLSGAGGQANAIAPLTWGLLVISISVVAIIATLVTIGVSRGSRSRISTEVSRPIAVHWIYWGVGLSSIPLLIALVWTLVVLARINSPPSEPALTIQIVAQQWWWRANYASEEPDRAITTANEIHIPVGEPVRIEVRSVDVIHSFWSPALAGKIDAIPGRTNVTWLEADQPGVFLGQCTEYCGLQHAHMQFSVIAQERDAFETWRNKQLAPAAPPASLEARAGQDIFVSRCGACHTVRGTLAGGRTGPPLTHLMSRESIAAGALPNETGALLGWIEDPHSTKPGTRMPAMKLSGPDLTKLLAYLSTLT